MLHERRHAHKIHIVRFYLHEVQEQANLSYNKSQKFIASEKKWEWKSNWKGAGRNLKKI